MLTRIILHNWQKHEELEITLAPLVSVTGASNSGKSSILRAIKWAMTNKPTGNRFIKRDEKECWVEIEADGHTVIRTKGKENNYLLDGKKYEAMGGGVPDEVVKLFDIGECNYQSQREGTLYWFGLTDGEVAKELDKVVDLSLIDRVMKNIGSQVRKQEKELDDARREWDVGKGECSRLAWADEADEELRAIEALRLVSIQREQKIDALQRLLCEIDVLERQPDRDAPEAELEELAELFQREKVLAGQISALERLIEEITATEQEVSTLTTRWQQETKNMRDAVGSICPVCRRPL